MNDQVLENKISQDAAKAKKDLNVLMDDGVAQVSKFGENFSQAAVKAKEDISTWVENGVSQLSEGFEKFTGEAKQTVDKAAAVVKKDVGQGLSQYNAKAQEVANKVPGNLGQKAAKYPWVAISIGLLVGLLLGSILKPARQPHG